MRLKLIIDDERASRKVLYPAVTNIHPDISIADLSRRIESDFKFSVKSLSLDGFTLLSKSATTDVLRDGDTVEYEFPLYCFLSYLH
ncbi:hypothetical protein BKA69DRAFT_23242 [Paraphysoderma sedebokerense]|nr:hypothetical protein BKA69DRAFT_23242 [Paraphysoderma sedebokerense]